MSEAEKVENDDPHPQVYEKRGGVVDHGKEFEYLMCAFYALKFSTADNVLDFEMSTNNKSFNDFDDLVLKVTFLDGNTKTFLLQLKHNEKKEKKLNIECFQDNKTKKDFSLPKYLKSFQKIEETFPDNNFHYILYTNRVAQYDNDSTLKLSLSLSPEVKVECVFKKHGNCVAEGLLNTNKDKDQSCSVFKFETTESPEFAHFFSKLYVYVNQQNYKNITQSMSEILKAKLKCDVSTNYIEFMKRWWEGKFYLSKNDIIAKLSELVFSPAIKTISEGKCNENSKLIREAIMKFDAILVEGPIDGIVEKIWEQKSDESQIKKTAMKYGLIASQGAESSPKEISKVRWYLDEVPLIVDVDDSNRNAVSCAVMLLGGCDKKKKLILTGKISGIDFSGWKVLRRLSDLSTDEHYQSIIANLSVRLQGRVTVSLEKLIGTDGNDVIGVSELFLIMKAKCDGTEFLIGEKREELPQYYVPRRLLVVLLNMNKLLKNPSDDILIINCGGNSKSIELFNHITVTKVDDYLSNKSEPCRFVIAENKCSKAELEAIFSHNSDSNIHVFKIINNNLMLVTSKIRNDHALKLKDFQCRKPFSVKENEIYEYLDNPVNVICAQPGMGKSTAMVYLRNESPGDYWSVGINLKEHNSFLKTKPKSENLVHHFLQLEELTNIKTMFLRRRKVLFFIDALDEIERDCATHVIHCIEELSSMGFRFWLSSRPHLQQELEDRLNLFSVNFGEFSRKEQEVFIYKRLQEYEEAHIKQIIDKIFSTNKILMNSHILGVPLQLYMITEIFLDDNHQTKEDVFVLTNIYRLYFEKKMRTWWDKGESKYDHLFKIDLDYELERYELPALQFCLDDDDFDLMDVDLRHYRRFLKKIKNEMDVLGLIINVLDDGKAVFVHRTFAEYLSCIWFANNFPKVRALKDQFFSGKYQNLKLMLDIFLSENYPLHLSIVYKNFKQVETQLGKLGVKDKGGRNPLQLACSYGTKYPPLKRYRDEINDRNVAALKEETPTYKQMIRKLLQLSTKTDFAHKDKLFVWTWLDYSIASQCLFPIEAVLTTHGDGLKLDPLYNTYDDGTLAYYSSRFGFKNLLYSVLAKDPSVITTKTIKGDSLLHLAVNGAHYEIVETLTRMGADVNAANHFKSGPLHLAIDNQDARMIDLLVDNGVLINRSSHFKDTPLKCAIDKRNMLIIDLLIKRGAQLDARDNLGRTPIFYAVKLGDYEIIKSLIDKGVDVNAKDTNGRTVLHLSTIKGDLQATTLLLGKGGEINATTNNGDTPLHYASRKGNTKIIKLLIDEGADVNAADNEGQSALFVAIEEGHFHAINELLKKEAGVNAATNSGDTPLHHAIMTKNTKIIQLLVEAGAEANIRNHEGLTALHLAAKRGQFDVAKVLIKAGAALVTPYGGSTLLHYAAQYGNTKIMSLLLEKNIGIDARDREGRTALHVSVQNGYYFATKLLVEAGADLEATTNDGLTALHFAVYKGHVKIVELFLNNRIDLRRVDVNHERFPLFFGLGDGNLQGWSLVKVTEDIKKKRDEGLSIEDVVEWLQEQDSTDC